MKNLKYRSSNRQLCISLDIYSPKENTVYLKAYDASRKNTSYIDRYHKFKGNQNFLIRLPQSPDLLTIEISSKSGDRIQLIKKDVTPLQTQMDAWDFKNKDIAAFVIFCQKFSDVAGYISPGKYKDDTGKYEITYLQTITSAQTGKELNTPARINAGSGIVQVSARIFRKYTIPGRVAILLHEFCHVFANGDMHSEIEADFHAAQIYCALGYPRVELLQVFADVFYGADTDLNRLRLNKLQQFVDNFDNHITSVKYGS
jgi:hypothetical protein